MLGTRTAPKEDLGASTAELVFGRPLTVPGDFIPDTNPVPPTQHLQQQRERVGNLRPVPTGAHGEKHIKTHVPASLQQAKYVFIRRDGKKSPLQTPYDGPYKVVEHSDKAFRLQVSNRQDTVSIDRLKPAYLDESQLPQVAEPPRRGRPPVRTTVAPLLPPSEASRRKPTSPSPLPEEPRSLKNQHMPKLHPNPAETSDGQYVSATYQL